MILDKPPEAKSPQFESLILELVVGLRALVGFLAEPQIFYRPRSSEGFGREANF